MHLFDRNNPFSSCIDERKLLNRAGSSKQTYHLALSIDPASVTYEPGDCAAILPSNSLEEVDAICHLLGFKHNPAVQEFLTKKANLRKLHPALIQKILGEDPKDLAQWIENASPADLITLRGNPSITKEELPRLFLPLLPRLYSIASSQLQFPKELHLLVALVQYSHNNQNRKGVASHFLCEEAVVKKTTIPLYIQRTRNFSLPHDSNLPIIMVGSGTGLAPFRAFMQHRLATHAKGRNWLFFGERNRATDFYYEDFFNDLHQRQLLRLSLAFSRDHAEKVYVQDLMWQERQDLWTWIREGAYFYVCGDAHCMAKDVETMFHRIAMSEGSLDEYEAHALIKKLRALKCYRTDIY